MKFYTLCEYLETLEKTSSRIQITKVLASLFKKIDANETAQAVNLLLGQLAPSFKNIVFNVAEKMEMAALSVAFNISRDQVKVLYKKEGDLGNVAFSLAKTKGNNLSIVEVYEKLYAVSEAGGEGSQEEKINLLAALFSQLSTLEAKYVARIPIGKLRLGFSDKTILDSLSWMISGDKSEKKRLESVYQVVPDVGLLAYRVKKYGIDKATLNAKPEVGIPVGAMLAQRLKSPTQMLGKMGGVVAVEPKLDGLRVQLHFDRKANKVFAYSRNLNEIGWMFPELGELGKNIKADKIILDSEAIGIEEGMQKMANFQTTMTRRRKHEIAETAAKVSISFYVFDILFCDGKNLMGEKYVNRRKILEKVVKDEKLLKVVESKIVSNPAEISSLNDKMHSLGFEGIMLKTPNGQYVPGRTGWRWVKMKEAETSQAKLADTVDGVVMGFSTGRGKRTQFGIGQFLVGILDGENIKTITKVGTGLTDDQFQDLYARLNKLTTDKKPKNYIVNKLLIPDFWVKPELVVELAADEITKSPNHTAGVALRFPRLVKFRDDKAVNQATNIKEIKNLQKLN